MYLSDAVRLILRRWVIVALGLALTVASGAAVLMLVNTQYQSTGEVLLLPPSDPVDAGKPTNPYLSLPSSLVFTSSLAASAVSSVDTAEDMEANGFLSTYAVAVIPGTGPLIAISVKSTDPLAATATRDELISRLDAHLADIQTLEDVSDDQLIVPRVVSAPSRAEVVAGARLRATATVLAIGGIATLFVAFGVDRLRSSRRRATPERMAVLEDLRPPTSSSNGGPRVAGLDDPPRREHGR